MKETLTLASAAAPQVFDYDLSLPAGVSGVLAGDGAVNLTAGGKTVGVLPKPFMDDAAGVRSAAVGYTLTAAGAGAWVLTAAADAGWLGDPARVWPVVLDPTVYLSYGTGNASCALISGAQAGVSHCGDQSFGVGTTAGVSSRGLVTFASLTSVLPLDAVVTHADFRPTETSSATGATQTVEIRALSRAWSAEATWNSYDGVHPWSSAGGDYTATAAGSAAVTATAGMAYTRRLDDRTGLAVNLAGGNLVLHATDLQLHSVGLSVSVARTYNSRHADANSTVGYGWMLDTGHDVRAALDDGDGTVTYLGPGGAEYVFSPNPGAPTGFTDAPGLGASVSVTGGAVTLTFHASGEVDTFNPDSTLASRADRNANTVGGLGRPAPGVNRQVIPYLVAESVT